MSKKENILTESPYLDYDEKAPAIKSEEFQKVIDSRRSVRFFKDEPIPDSIVEQCLQNALLAPNSSNLQPWEFYRIQSKDLRKKINHACLDQVAAKSAAELIIAVARTATWKKHAAEMLEMFKKSGKDVPRSAYQYYGKIVPFVYSQGIFSFFGFIKRFIYFFKGISSPIIREPVTKQHMRLWAAKTTALGAENLMLSFRAYGYDSCPMEGLDSKRVKKLLGLPGDAIVVMAIAAGKRTKGGIYGEQVRFDPSRFIKTV